MKRSRVLKVIDSESHEFFLTRFHAEQAGAPCRASETVLVATTLMLLALYGSFTTATNRTVVCSTIAALPGSKVRCLLSISASDLMACIRCPWRIGRSMYMVSSLELLASASQLPEIRQHKQQQCTSEATS